MNFRERMIRTLTFSTPANLPDNFWILPWFGRRYPQVCNILSSEYGEAIGKPPRPFAVGSRAKGNPYDAGVYFDDFGCEFLNLEDGIMGEVKNPPLEDLSLVESYPMPFEVLSSVNTRDAQNEVTRYCNQSSQFMLANVTINIWERYQFLRGSENALMDMVQFGPECEMLLNKIVEYYHAELDFWLGCGVDGIMFADDWGSQTALLISPDCWRERFKPLYREFFKKVHDAGKFVFFHTDGCIEQIFGDFVELGVDAINSQLFTMNIPELGRKYKGKITFWGEVDRQNILPGAPEAAEKAVELICEHLYMEQGGLIRQFEAGPGANPDTVLAAIKKWHTLVP